MTDTRQRYRDYADRIESVSPTYAAWARSLDDAVVDLLQQVPPAKRQPELVFAVARRLGADPSDAGALRALGQEARPALVSALTAGTVQANDPRRLGAVLPLFAHLAATSDAPLGIVDVGAAAGLCSIPDRVTLDHVVTHGAGRRTVRMHTAAADPSVHLVVRTSGVLPPPATGSITVGARVALDPHPVDLREPGAFDRLVEAVPPEATDRTALMRDAAHAALAVPPVLVTGTVPDDLDRALDALPDGCAPVVLTTGTLVYVPGADRQRFVDRVRARGLRWISMERAGVLTDVARSIPAAAADPTAFATIALDGVALAHADAFGTRTDWFRAIR